MKANRGDSGRPIGSPNSIQSHIMTWREAHRPADVLLPLPQLPASVAIEVNRSIQTAANQARADADARWLQANEELKELAATGENHEFQIDELTSELVICRGARDTLEGQLRGQATQVLELKEAIRTEQVAAEALRKDAVRDGIRLSGALARDTEAVGRESLLQEKVTMAQMQLADEQKAKYAAERRADLADVLLNASAKAQAESEIRIDGLLKIVHGIEGMAGRTTSAEAAAAELRNQVAMLHALLTAAATSAAATSMSTKSPARLNGSEQPARSSAIHTDANLKESKN